MEFTFAAYESIYCFLVKSKLNRVENMINLMSNEGRVNLVSSLETEKLFSLE
jgi:hypothetical protein